jgi:hypothetical protein
MVQESNLVYWKSDYDTLDITQLELNRRETDLKPRECKIDLSKLSLGHNKPEVDLDLKDFVTYVRKSDLKYEEEYYERFVFVIINSNDIRLIPFDWFNRNGGDYGYVWPATARIDSDNKLHGQGMRMSDFQIDIDKPGEGEIFGFISYGSR